MGGWGDGGMGGIMRCTNGRHDTFRQRGFQKNHSVETQLVGPVKHTVSIGTARGNPILKQP